MAVNYNMATKNARMQAVLDNIDAAATPATLEICTAGYSLVLAVIELAKPSFSLAGGVLTMLNPPRTDPSADATGTASIARILDGAGVTVVDGLTVGVTTGNVQLNSVALSAGQTLSLSSGMISHA